MMWDRRELKAKGKAAFRANYWKCVLVALIFALFLGGGAYSGSNSVHNADESTDNWTQILEALREAPREMLYVIGGALVGGSVIAVALKLLVINPLKVGCKRFFLVNSVAPAELNELGFGFKNGYGNMVTAMFLRDLFTTLWAMLFIIPGIIKAYSYRMVPFILAENPDMSATEAIRCSREMMNGHKWNAFMLDLSFLGWIFLTVLTADVVGVFWASPYMEATDAELYQAIK